MRIGVLGAGYGGLRAALDLDHWLGDRDRVEITLVDRHDYHQLVTELHKPAAGAATEHRLAIPVRDVLRGTRIRFCQRGVRDILPDDGAVLLEGGTAFRYDRLVVALGGSPEYFDIPGVAEHSLTISSINSARMIREHLARTFHEGSRTEDPERRTQHLTVVIAGGGFTGVELAGELADRLPRLARDAGVAPEDVRLITIEALPELLRGFSRRLVEEATRTLTGKKVELLLGVPITAVDGDGVELADGRRIPAKTVIWTGGVRGNPIVERRFPTRGRGRAAVNEFLQSVGYPDVYLIGDCAFAVDPDTQRPVAPTAQHAIEQGRVAARNIWAEYTGRKLRPYRPVTKGVVVSVGRGMALARLGRFNVSGAGPVILKDVITWLYLYSLGGYRLVLQYALSHLSLSGPAQVSDPARGRDGPPSDSGGEGKDRRRLAAYRPGELPPGATLAFPQGQGAQGQGANGVPTPAAGPAPASVPPADSSRG